LLIAEVFTLGATAVMAWFILHLDLSLEGKKGAVNRSGLYADNAGYLIAVAALFIVLIWLIYRNWRTPLKPRIGLFLFLNIGLLMMVIPLLVASLHPIALGMAILLLMSTFICATSFNRAGGFSE